MQIIVIKRSGELFVKKLGCNYGKPFVKYSKKAEDAEEHLNKTQKT